MEDFIEEWGQTHEEICANLGYNEEDADDLLVMDYFYYEPSSVWIPIYSSCYTEEEEKIADELRNK